MIIGEVNCDEQRDMCKKANVESYPSIIYFPGDGSKQIKYSESRTA